MRIPSPWNVHITWIGSAGAAIAAGMFASGGTSWELGIAIMIVLSQFVVPAAYVVALAHILLPIALDTTPTLLWLIGLETGCLLILIGTTTAATGDSLIRHGLRFVGASILLASTVVSSFVLASALWPVVVVLLVTFSILAYTLHRYERLQLGFLGERS